jgi:hypothetical protein
VRASRITAFAGLLALAASQAPATASRAQAPLAGTARLEGQFQLAGQITVARHVLGERVGETVVRTWIFTPRCAAGPCRSVALTRQRATGTDKLVLHLTATNHYSGTGKFFAPLRCGNRIVRKGESVPFTIQVQITGASLVNGVPVATQVSASYTNRKRTNLTLCVAVPGHDAAVYLGSLQL